MSYNNPNDFLQKHDVNTIVQEALNATYASGSSSPVAFLAQYFTEQNSVNAIQSVTANEVLDGCGSVALEVHVKLANGLVGTAVSSHCNHHFHGLATTGSLLVGGDGKEGGGKSDKKADKRDNNNQSPDMAASQLNGGNVGHPSTARVAVLKTDKVPTLDAKELRRQRHAGNGLLGPAHFINKRVGPALVGLPVNNQEEVDAALQAVDGTENFANLGAQCAAAVSVAVAQTASISKKQPAFVQVASNYFAQFGIPRSLNVPTPVVTLFSSEPKWLGKVRVLEVCLIPNLQTCAIQAAAESTGAPSSAANTQPGEDAAGDEGEDGDSQAGDRTSVADGGNAGEAAGATSGGEEGGHGKTGAQHGALVTPSAVRQAMVNCMKVIEEAQAKLHEDGHVVVVNSDGGLKFNTPDSLQALVEYAEDAIKDAGLTLGKDMFLGLVVDAAYCYKSDSQKYAMVDGQGEFSGAQLAEYFATFLKESKKDKIVYLEDPLTDKDSAEMKRLMFRLGGTNTAVASNNFTAGNPENVLVAGKEKQCNTLALRLNDAGSVSNAITQGQNFQQQYPGAALSVVGEAFLGAKSAEFLADFATGVGATFLRGGGLLRPDHAAVYNRLAEIEGELENLGLAPSGGAPGKYNAGCANFESLELPAAPTEAVVEVNAKDAKKRK